jgi:hypothetical protein
MVFVVANIDSTIQLAKPRKYGQICEAAMGGLIFLGNSSEHELNLTSDGMQGTTILFRFTRSGRDEMRRRQRLLQEKRACPNERLACPPVSLIAKRDEFMLDW